jgi:phosphoglycolate phosphatase-like HAD superfamily hydrolase
MQPKLLLFDIDGTILSARGIPRIVMKKVLSQRYSNFSYDEEFDFSGRTDPEIIEHLLIHAQIEFSDKDINEILVDFALLLEREFKNNHQPFLLDGVANLINTLLSTDCTYLGLVTGNIAEGARIKLESVGLYKNFPIGGFGDDSKNRDDLPPIAQERAEEFYDIQFSKHNIWIIGDSIYDIKCAEVNNLRCLAVASGKTQKHILASASPEFLKDNLSDTQSILKILLNT